MDCGNKTATAGGLYPRLLREVGDLAFTIAIASSIPNTPYFFYNFEQSGI
jgi:hypothetical protein